MSRHRRPRDLLSSAASVVVYAAERGSNIIDAVAVEEALAGDVPIVTVDYTEGLAAAT